MNKVLSALPLLAASLLPISRNESVGAADKVGVELESIKETVEEFERSRIRQPLAEKSPAEKLATTKPVLPKLFINHDFDRNGKIDIFEAIEFCEDKSLSIIHVDSDGNGEITKKEMEDVITWFKEVSILSDISNDEKKICLDIAARLHEYMNYKDPIPMPLPRIFAKFDNDKDGKISLEEALLAYETLQGIKLEKDPNEQITPGSLREVIDTFDSPYKYKLPVGTSSAANFCSKLATVVLKEYEKLYGSYTPTKSKSIITLE